MTRSTHLRLNSPNAAWVPVSIIPLLVAGCGSSARVTRSPDAPANNPTAARLTANQPASQPVTGKDPVAWEPLGWVDPAGAEQNTSFNNNEERPSQTLALFGQTSVIAASAGPSEDPAENLRQVSFSTEGADFDPAISTDGTRLFFASTAHRNTPDIYVKSIDGRALTQLTNDPASDVMPAVSPDGSRIAFASNRNGSWDLFIMNSTGGQAVQITTDGTHELHPSWSPDGRMITFSKLGEVSGRWEIWVTEAEQAGVQRFLTYGLFPDWHPSDNKIVFQRSRDRGDRLFSIWTLSYARGEATALTEIASSPGQAFINPSWSLDGKFIAFSGVPNPSSMSSDQQPPVADVWIVSSSGSGLSNLTGGKYANLMPTWGPGNTILFASDRTGRQNIWSSSSEQALIAGRAIDPNGSMTAASDHSAPASSGHGGAHAANPDMRSRPLASKGAAPAPAPAQSGHDEAPEMANVPIDEQEH